MLCRNPYTTSDGKAYGCGQCTPCRVNRRRKWQARIMLEARQYEDNSFVTLTYDDEHMPKTIDGLGTLKSWDLRNFLDNLRYHFGTMGRRGIRYYAVGEYGDETFRPHYHLAMFNVPTCVYKMSMYSKLRVSCCPTCELVRKLWGRGHIYLGTLERDSAGYVASYVTKGMSKKDDPRLGLRYPEFARMSLRPGIGHSAMWEVADVLMKYGLMQGALDVPYELKEGKKSIPLDRYLRRNLRTMVGRDAKASQEFIDTLAEEMSSVRARATYATGSSRMKFDKDLFRGLLLDESESDYQRFMHRRKLFNKRRGTL